MRSILISSALIAPFIISGFGQPAEAQSKSTSTCTAPGLVSASL